MYFKQASEAIFPRDSECAGKISAPQAGINPKASARKSEGNSIRTAILTERLSFQLVCIQIDVQVVNELDLCIIKNSINFISLQNCTFFCFVFCFI